MGEDYQKKVPKKITDYQEGVKTLADEFTKTLQLYSNGDRNVSRSSDEVYSNFMAINANLENVKRGLMKNFRDQLENEGLLNVLEKHIKDESNSLENLVFKSEGNVEWTGACNEPEFVTQLKTLISSTYNKNEELEEQLKNYEEDNKKLRKQNREYEIQTNHLNFELDELKTEKDALVDMIKSYEKENKELTEQNKSYDAELNKVKNKYVEMEKLWKESEEELKKKDRELKGQLEVNKNSFVSKKQDSTGKGQDFSEIVDSDTKNELFSIYRKIKKEKSGMNLDERTIKLGEMLGEITLEYRRLKQEHEQTLEKLDYVAQTREKLYKQRSQVLGSHRKLARKKKNLEGELQIAKNTVEELQDELDNYKERLNGSNRLISVSEGLLEQEKRRAHRAEMNYDEALHENIELSERINSMTEYINNLENNYNKLSDNHAKILSKLDDTENFLEAINKKAQQINLVSALKDILAKRLGYNLNQTQTVLENTYSSLESAQEQVRQKETEAEIIEAEYTQILSSKEEELRKTNAYLKALEKSQKKMTEEIREIETGKLKSLETRIKRR
ncbi:MAG: hypothetical protein ACOCQG_00475 [Candidatus Nanoarchaeia archaeon]